MMKDKNNPVLSIALIYGGRSGEHEVSRRSAASLFQHLDRNQYRVIPMGISRRGLWYLQPIPEDFQEAVLPLSEEPAQRLSFTPGQGFSSAAGEEIPVDFAFPIVHGTYGEDGTLQGFLEILGIPYAGGRVLGSALGMAKDTVKEVWEHAGLPVVPWHRLTRTQESSPQKKEAFCRLCEEEFGYPLFIKPIEAGSSVGVSRAENRDEMETAITQALRYDLALMAEPEIKGREIECSVIGNEAPIAFPPGEIKPSHTFYDYEAKYIDPDGAELMIPSPLPAAIAEDVQNLARQAFSAARLTGFSRVDFFYCEDSGELYLNEINTLPGFTSISMFPALCAEGGLDYSRLLDELIRYGIAAHEASRSREVGGDYVL